ncbi:MAG TPA: capsule biosynthesis protein [Steroidobacteraceae bacterium]|nr:capsule biosynthesis protein [Steroidobacteraceae bacterium]
MRLISWLKRNVVLVATVIVPTLGAIIYFGLIASDVYISESRFLVRSPQQKMEGAGLFGNLLQGTGLSRAQDDTYSVHDFMLSRDALRALDASIGIRNAFSAGGVDPFNRFPGLFRDRSFEELYRYYGNHIEVEYDSTSSISTLTVRAFSAADAQRINDALLHLSEGLVNGLNERSRQDLVRFAEADVKVATDKAAAAAVALFAYRSKNAVFEPDKQAEIQLESVAKIQQDLVATEAQLAQLRKLSPTNPQIAGLESRAETLRGAIETEAGKVTSANGSFSARAQTFERLTVDSMFADKQLGATLADLEAARSEALRKQLYLERLVQPSLPDKAMEPRRIRSVFTVFLMGLIVWGVASLVIAAIREHSD